jgi:predicted DNA-binding protein
MKTAILTIRLDKELDELLSKASRRTGKNRSEIAREA